MRICLFSGRNPHHTLGGAETYMLYLARYFSEWGHQVVLAYPAGQTVRPIRLATWAARKLLRIDVSELYDNFRLLPDVSKIDADIYHGQGLYSFGFGMIRRLGWRSTKAFISTAHGSAWGLAQSCPWSNATTKLIRVNMERAAFNASDRVISVSNSTRGEIVKGYGVNPDRVRVIHNGVDPNRYLSKSRGKFELYGSEDQFVITFFARGGSEKARTLAPGYFKPYAGRLARENVS